MKLIKYFFEAIIIYLFFLIAKLLGLNKSRKFFGFIFSKIGPYFKSKKIILNNLKKVFDNNQIKEEIIINEMWKNYGMTFAEYMHLSFFKDPLNNDLIKVNGRSILDKIVKEKKPVIFVSGHFGNFEMMSLELSKSGVYFG